jgi:hypothetical protein
MLTFSYAVIQVFLRLRLWYSRLLATTRCLNVGLASAFGLADRRLIFVFLIAVASNKVRRHRCRLEVSLQLAE